MSAIYHRCACPHCQQDLEYPDELAAQVINCPLCSQAMTLPEAGPLQPPRGFFQWFKDAGQGVLDKRKLKTLLMESVSDGVLTAQEVEEIRSVMQQTGIDRSIIAEWSDELFERAVDSITLANVSTARIDSVEQVRQFVGAHEATVQKQLQRLDRWRMLAKIREGTLPSVRPLNVVLRRSEIAHWVERAKLWEERVVSRRYEGGSRGVSFRICKGVSIRAGASRGQLISETADVAICDGNLVITNQRLIFQGETKSFETKLENIIDIHNHIDGLRYSESNKQKPRKLQYYSSNGDIIVEILSQLFSRCHA